VDPEAFERLYQQHCDAVRAYVRRRQPGDEVDEALAEVWLVAWRRRRTLPPEPLP
jgi:RNA polymerase sigma-70 factor (ECF subfamily)